jgi:hypothetical protein
MSLWHFCVCRSSARPDCDSDRRKLLKAKPLRQLRLAGIGKASLNGDPAAKGVAVISLIGKTDAAAWHGRQAASWPCGNRSPGLATDAASSRLGPSRSAWILVGKPPRERPMPRIEPSFFRSHRAGEPGAKTCRSSPTRRQRLGLPPRVASPTPRLCASAHSNCSR